MKKKAVKKSSKINTTLFYPFKWFSRHWLKVLLILSLSVTFYMIYLDAQIKPRFEGNKWQVPVQVYARPLILDLKQEIDIQEVIDELNLLGYRKSAKADSVGEYKVLDDGLIVYRREFYYPDKIYPEQKIRIQWDETRISEIKLADSTVNFTRTSLEPWLVSRLTSGLDEDRMLLSEDEIPQTLKTALIVVEDQDFYEHHGVAPLSILRALVANISAGRTVQGGSTLTQQLVKNLFLTREQSYARKLKEAAMALVIDFRYSKEEILTAYINEVFLAQNGAVAVHGFGLGSHYFFNKPLDELETHEIATLVGLVKGPSFYDPKRHIQRATERRNLVLRLLFQANEISRIEYENSLSHPLKTDDSPSLASGKHPAFMSKVSAEINDVVTLEETRKSGIKVFTTLDINTQRRAEQALKTTVERKSKAYNQPDLEAAMVISDISSGGIRAIIGGKQTDYSGFNRALNAIRPIGSLVKPITFLAALEQPERFNLATLLKDEPVTFDDADGKTWQPQNADKKFRGSVPLIQALVKSYNVPSVNLAQQIGFEEVVSSLNRLGADISAKALPSVALGAVELSPLQINQIYQTISNNGVYKPLYSLFAVTTHDEQLLWKRQSRQQVRANEDATYLLNYALHKVTTNGTAKALGKAFPDINMAGKTGTTDDYRDSWFVGFDRNLVTSIWMGNDNNQPINMSGATGALPIYIALQKQQSPKTLVRRFPTSLTIAHFDKTNGQPTLPGCPNVISLPAIKASLDNPTTCDSQPVEIKQENTKKRSWWERLFG